MTPPRLGSRWNRPNDPTVYVVERLEDRGRVRMVAENPDATKHPRLRTTIEAMAQYWTEVTK